MQVVTARLRGCPDESLLEGVEVHRVGFDSLKEVAYYYFSSHRARGRVGIQPQGPGRFGRIIAWLYTAFWKTIFFPDDACVWYFPARRRVLSLLRREQPDLLISVSLPFTGHLLGLAAKRHFPALRWLADIGDPFAYRVPPPNNTFLYGNINQRLEREVLEKSDAQRVTTTATLLKYREIFGEQSVRNMQVIPPLLKQNTVAPAASGILSEAETIRLGFFGALYAPIRTPDAFLDLLAQVFALQPEWQKRLQVHWYGEVFPEFYEKLSRFPNITLHGLRSREEVHTAMQDMDVLINIGNITDFQLPSKAVDYLASGKPVLNLSYTKFDPFADFFGDNNLIFNVKVVDGKLAPPDVLRWLRWLETPKLPPDSGALEERLAPFRTEAIGEAYLRGER